MADNAMSDDIAWIYGLEILSHMIRTSNYNVFVASINCFDTILDFIQHCADQPFDKIFPWVKPILEIILTKCADDNKKIGEKSLEVLLFWCSNLQDRMNSLSQRMARHMVRNGFDIACPSLTYDNEAIDLILYIINEDQKGEPSSKQCQHNNRYTFGRLACLNALLRRLSDHFKRAQQAPDYPRIMVTIDFAFRHLEVADQAIRECALQIFMISSDMAFASDSIGTRQFIEQLIVCINDRKLRHRLWERNASFLLEDLQVNASEIIKHKIEPSINCSIDETSLRTSHRNEHMYNKENTHCKADLTMIGKEAFENCVTNSINKDNAQSTTRFELKDISNKFRSPLGAHKRSGVPFNVVPEELEPNYKQICDGNRNWTKYRRKKGKTTLRPNTSRYQSKVLGKRHFSRAFEEEAR